MIIQINCRLLVLIFDSSVFWQLSVMTAASLTFTRDPIKPIIHNLLVFTFWRHAANFPIFRIMRNSQIEKHKVWTSTEAWTWGKTMKLNCLYFYWWRIHDQHIHKSSSLINCSVCLTVHIVITSFSCFVISSQSERYKSSW